MRAIEERKLKDNPHFTEGDVISINLTRLEGGVQTNVIPSKISLGYDIRISLNSDIPAFEKQVCFPYIQINIYFMKYLF